MKRGVNNIWIVFKEVELPTYPLNKSVSWQSSVTSGALRSKIPQHQVVEVTHELGWTVTWQCVQRDWLRKQLWLLGHVVPTRESHGQTTTQMIAASEFIFINHFLSTTDKINALSCSYQPFSREYITHICLLYGKCDINKTITLYILKTLFYQLISLSYVEVKQVKKVKDKQ